MSAESDFEEARRRIEEAKTDEARELDLSNLTELVRIPDAITELRFSTLNMDRTDVRDLRILASMDNLQALYLSSTPVVDLSPLSSLSQLSRLDIDYTSVADISPLASNRQLRMLNLSATNVTDLSPLTRHSSLEVLYLAYAAIEDISPLDTLPNLSMLDLAHTNVVNLSPLANAKLLHWLRLSHSAVNDLSSLAKLTELTTLHLEHTPVRDLRILLRFPRLETPESTFEEVRFAGCSATTLDPQLAEIAKVEHRANRAKRLFARLREIGDDWPPVPQKAPDQQGAPRIDLVDGQIDLVHSRPDASEQSDPVKQKALERLREAVVHMCRVGNRYPDLDTCSRRLARLIEPDLAEIDLLEVHFELEIIRGIYNRRDEREGEDRLDAEAVGALDRVGMVGPGLTLDNADVERLEERRRRYREDPPSGETRKTQDDLSQSIADAPQLFGEDLREISDRLAAMEAKSDRQLAFQNDGNRNVIIVAGIAVADKLLWGMAGGPLSGVGNAASDWLVANGDTILFLADHWGEAFRAWITPILMRAREAASAASRLTKRH